MTDRETTPEPPSRGSILGCAVLTFWAVALTFYVGSGLLGTDRELAGFGLGVVASLSLLGQTAGRAIRRASVLADQTVHDPDTGRCTMHAEREQRS
jgi:hypothetical protein